MRASNEPKLDAIKLTPKIKLAAQKIRIMPTLAKTDPLIRLLKNVKSK